MTGISLTTSPTRSSHIENQTPTLYTGNYTAFETRRAEMLAQRQAALRETTARNRPHLHSYVDRFRAKATKARQAQSRLKALARMELISPAHADSVPSTSTFLPPPNMPRIPCWFSMMSRCRLW